MEQAEALKAVINQMGYLSNLVQTLLNENKALVKRVEELETKLKTTEPVSYKEAVIGNKNDPIIINEPEPLPIPLPLPLPPLRQPKEWVSGRKPWVLPHGRKARQSKSPREEEECPVCFEPLNSQTTFSSTCQHTVCFACHKSLSACPICRADY